MFDLFNYKELFDSHCHLSAEQFDADRQQVIERAYNAGVKVMIDVATDMSSAVKALELSRKYQGVVYPTAGIHAEVCVPGSDLYIDDVSQMLLDEQLAELDDFITNQRDEILMLGECGLDKYWLEQNQELTTQQKSKLFELQLYLFEGQIALAKKHRLPLTIHTRDAWPEMLELMADHAHKVNAFMHSFTGDLETAEQLIAFGYKLGINGIATFKKSQELRDVLAKLTKGKEIKTPKDLYDLGIYLESDSPYLSPEPKRGERNEPGNIKVIWNSIKEI